MIDLACVLARMGNVALPAWVQAQPGQLADVFAGGSSGDIRLNIDNRLGGPPAGPSAVVEAYDLHRATAALAANPNPPADRVGTVVAIFAGRYRTYDRVFGIMFDRGFTTLDDPNNKTAFKQHPREGCAVFLDAIRDRRPEQGDFEQESRFTAIHEIAHLFNLQHTSEPSYLVQSLTGAPYGNGYRQFTEDQKRSLRNCSTSPNVWPGGARFGDTGQFGSTNAALARTKQAPSNLELKIALPSQRFWPFEPIELDVELHVASGTTRSARVPDRLDPGYDDFQIWIEDPNGERRLFRSPRRYCAFPAQRSIRAADAFRRDISIFGQAGGLTFRTAGVHRLWAEFMVRPGAWLTSKPVECEVLGADDSSLYGAARDVLSRRAASLMLYHRRLDAGTSARRLENFIASHGHWEGLGRVQYGLGRALVATAKQRPGAASAFLARRGLEHLGRALDHGQLGGHQRSRAERMLAGAQ